LGNTENRKQYDKKHADELDNAQQQRQQLRGGYQGQSSSHFSDSEYSDFFESMFGGGGRSRGGNVKFKGQDYNAEYTLT